VRFRLLDSRVSGLGWMRRFRGARWGWTGGLAWRLRRFCRTAIGCGAWLVIGRWQLELRAFEDFAGIEADAFVLRVRGDAMVRVHVGEDEFVELGLRDGTLVVE